jgi:hypothetical protein
MTAGFRIPQRKLQGIDLPGPEIRGMIWPGVRPPIRTAVARPAAATVFAMPVEQPPIRFPAPPTADFERRFEWPGIIRTRIRFVDCANRQWTASAPFGCPDDLIFKENDEHYGR